MKNRDVHPLVSDDDETLVLTVRVRDACRMTGISRSKLYELIKEGHLKTLKVGTITLISVAELRDFLGLGRA